MAKVVSLPQILYNDLASVSGELTIMARKPVSLAMSVSILIAVFHAHVSEPCARDALAQRLANANMMSPEEFDKVWDKSSSVKSETKNEKHKPQ